MTCPATTPAMVTAPASARHRPPARRLQRAGRRAEGRVVNVGLHGDGSGQRIGHAQGRAVP